MNIFITIESPHGQGWELCTLDNLKQRIPLGDHYIFGICSIIRNKKYLVYYLVPIFHDVWDIFLWMWVSFQISEYNTELSNAHSREMGPNKLVLIIYYHYFFTLLWCAFFCSFASLVLEYETSQDLGLILFSFFQ
jgi:hypothetical protein